MKNTYLYKYVKTAYKTGEPNYFDLLVANNSIWFSSPHKFNDIYDCNFNLDYSQLDSDEMRTILLRAAHELTDPNKRQMVINNLTVVQSDAGKRLVSEVINSDVKKVLSEIGVACFTEKPDNDLMWAHYTDSHSGACLIFDPDIDERFFNTLRGKVNYSDTPPIIDKLGMQDLLTYIFTKSKRWEYEKEVRLVRDTENAFPFIKEALVGIIFGFRMPTSERQRIQALLGAHGYNVKYHEMKSGKGPFSLAIKEL